ncbi:MAG: HAMP domain-containing protein, partial [Aliifodinibius sp.]|nr:HAMP domain-containing protein [Fodinibius sp.]
MYNQIKNDLQKYVGLAEASLNSRAIIKKDSPYLKHYVDTIGNILNSRITIIDINGRVLADSEIPTEELDEVENHIKRPEVQQSLKDKFGFRIRHSATIDKDLLYMSKLIRIDQEKVGFLRIALFAEDTDQMLGQVQTYFIGGGVLVFVISTLLVILLSRRFNRNLTEVIKKARQISDGDLQVKIQVDSNDELNELGAALNEMSAELSRYLRKLALERQDLNTVLSSIHEGIIAITPKKKIIFFNTIALQQLNCPEEKIIRKYYYHVIRNQHLLSLIDNFFAKQL